MAYISLWLATIMMIIVGSTNGDYYDGFSREELLRQYQYVRHFNRGKFEREDYSDSQLKEMSTYDVNDRVKSITREFDCNHLYNMLVFLHLMSPDDYADTESFNNIDVTCQSWDQLMLTAKMNVNFSKAKSYLVKHWLFYFYIKKMDLHVRSDKPEDFNSDVRNLHSILYNSVQNDMKTHCLSHDEFDSYMEDIKEAERGLEATLEMLSKICTGLYEFKDGKNYFQGFQHFNLHQLNMAIIIEKSTIMNTLITDFGGLENGNKIVEYLSDKVKIIKNPMTSLFDFVHSIRMVHLTFFRVVKTIMLRITWKFLKNLKTFNVIQTPKLTSTFQQSLIKLANVIKLNKNDEFRQIIDLLSSWVVKHSIWLVYARGRIINLLKIYDKYEFLEDAGNHEIESLRKVNIQSCALKKNPSKNIDTNQHTASPAQESILCAQVFVDYLENIFNNELSIDDIQLFDEFDYTILYDKDLLKTFNK